MVTIPPTVGVILAALFWGVTNPFIADAGRKPYRLSESQIPILRRLPDMLPPFAAETVATICNVRFIVPWVINLVGSLFFLVALGSGTLAYVSVVTNALTLCVTAVVGAALFGERAGKRPGLVALGCVFVFVGTVLCSQAP